MEMVGMDKQRTVDEAVKLLRDYEVVCAADLYKLGSVMLQSLRRQLRGQIAIKCVKNTLMKIAMEKAGLQNSDKFLSGVAGSTIFIFSHGNPFKLTMMLNRNKVKVLSKPGDIALTEITIPAGNTGLSPGPIIGKFGALGIRTRIEGGNIWVNQDAEVAKAGDKISEDLADILARLGIKASEMGLSIKSAYDRGLVIPQKDLLLDLETYRNNMMRMTSDAHQVALKSSYLIPLTAPTLLSIADKNARRVAIAAEYLTSRTVKELIATATAYGQTLQGIIQSKKGNQ